MDLRVQYKVYSIQYNNKYKAIMHVLLHTASIKKNDIKLFLSHIHV